jgi:hypothetical protein
LRLACGWSRGDEPMPVDEVREQIKDLNHRLDELRGRL